MFLRVLLMMVLVTGQSFANDHLADLSFEALERSSIHHDAAQSYQKIFDELYSFWFGKERRFKRENKKVRVAMHQLSFARPLPISLSFPNVVNYVHLNLNRRLATWAKLKQSYRAFEVDEDQFIQAVNNLASSIRLIKNFPPHVKRKKELREKRSVRRSAVLESVFLDLVSARIAAALELAIRSLYDESISVLESR